MSLPDFTPEEEAKIRQRIRERGVVFEVFLPEGLADWLKAKIADDTFESYQEAAFVAFGDLRDLMEFPDARLALLRARVQAAINDDRPPLSGEQVFRDLEERIRRLAQDD